MGGEMVPGMTVTLRESVKIYTRDAFCKNQTNNNNKKQQKNIVNTKTRVCMCVCKN